MSSLPLHLLRQHSLGRRGLLVAAPLSVFALASESLAQRLLTPFGSGGRAIFDAAGRASSAMFAASGTTASSTPSRAAMEKAVVAAMGGRSQVVGVSVLDRRTGTHWSYRGDALIRTGSVAKTLIVTQALRQARADGSRLTSRQREQARLAITISDNASASALYTWIGMHRGVVSIATDLGMVDTAKAKPADHWGHTLTSANDLITMMQALVGGHPALHDDDNAYLLDLMGRVVNGQRWGVGTVGSSSVEVRLKNGWMAVDNPWVINSVGDVRGNGRDYALAIMQRAQADQSPGMSQASRISRAVYSVLREPLR